MLIKRNTARSEKTLVNCELAGILRTVSTGKVHAHVVAEDGSDLWVTFSQDEIDNLSVFRSKA